jgi:hypothetical protein
MKYICTGRVQPEHASVMFGPITLALDGGGSAVTSCDASQITVVLDVPYVDGFIAARLIAIDVANIVVGSLGFVFGYGYSVDMVQVIEENGNAHVFGVQPTGAPLVVVPEALSFTRAVHLAGKDVHFRQAVRDYLRAMTMDTDCAGYCFRAIEGIKSGFAAGKAGWKSMHAALGTDGDLIKQHVQNFADDSRHGNWLKSPSANSAQRWQMLLIREMSW